MYYNRKMFSMFGRTSPTTGLCRCKIIHDRINPCIANQIQIRIFINDGYQILFCVPAVTKDDDMIFAVKFRHNLPDHGGWQFQFRFFFSGCFCDILIRGRIRPERKYYVTKIICFFQERNRFVNCSDPGASFYVLGQTG